MDLRISELTELSSLNDDDYLVLQRNDGVRKQSYKISFNNFKSQFQKKINTLGIGSAAYCNAIQFAPFAHGHDYSDIWYFPSYGPQSHNVDPVNRSSLCCINNGEFNIVTYKPGIDQKQQTTIQVWQPPLTNTFINEVSAYNLHYMHKVGDVQLLAVNDFNTYLTSYRKYEMTNGNVNIYPSSSQYVFDGFVIPNGQTFTCAYNKFKSACKAYSSSHNENATSFTVPNLLDTFFKCDPGLPASQVQPLASIQSTNGMPAHTHSSRVMSSSSSSALELPPMQLAVRATQNVSETLVTNRPQFRNSVHYAKSGRLATPATSFVNSDDVCPRIMALNLTCDIESTAICQSSGEGGNVYPNHTHMQLLLYIGMPDD